MLMLIDMEKPALKNMFFKNNFPTDSNGLSGRSLLCTNNVKLKKKKAKRGEIELQDFHETAGMKSSIIHCSGVSLPSSSQENVRLYFG